jgi:penicillin-binding protein 1B
MAALIGLFVTAWHTVRFAQDVETRFQQNRTIFPSRVYARPVVLYRGMPFTQAGLAQQLGRLGYRSVTGPDVSAGEYISSSDMWILGIRPFMHGNGRDEGGKVYVQIDSKGQVVRLTDGTQQDFETVRIEPAEIGAFLSEDNKDRIREHLSAVPRHLIRALLTAEDRRFFDHGAIDLRRIAGAFHANLRNREIVEGASTITQQLVRSIFLSREQTLARKLREVLIASVLESRHTKNEILEAYLNEVYFGQDGAIAIHGVGLASRHYFGKHVSNLDLAESALLVGLIRSPSLHAPFRYPDAAIERRNFILRQMYQQEEISRDEYQAAVDSPLGLRDNSENVNAVGYFTDFLRERLAKRYGEKALEQEGWSIYTTLDLRMQKLAQEIVSDRLEALEIENSELRNDRMPVQAALVVLEPRTGQILAMVGGRNYAESQYNRVFAQRQPGSIFKPIVVLAALKRQADGRPASTLATLLQDEPYHMFVWKGESSNMKWVPRNHDRRFRGKVTTREALEWSLNVPMTRLGSVVGLTEIISTARRMGITSPLEPVPSLPLGSFETNLLEVARAYAVLASGGLRAPVRDVLSIFEGEKLRDDFSEAAPFRVFRSSETFLVTSVLQGSVDRGTSTHLRDLGYFGAVAGKTGSTNRFMDTWFVGYTPEIVIGAWVGFDVGRVVGMPGAQAALPIVADFMIQVLGPNGAARFIPPPGVERVRVAIRKDGTCHYTYEFFLTGTAPTETCVAIGQSADEQAVTVPVAE